MCGWYVHVCRCALLMALCLNFLETKSLTEPGARLVTANPCLPPTIWYQRLTRPRLAFYNVLGICLHLCEVSIFTYSHLPNSMKHSEDSCCFYERTFGRTTTVVPLSVTSCHQTLLSLQFNSKLSLNFSTKTLHPKLGLERRLSSY